MGFTGNVRCCGKTTVSAEFLQWTLFGVFRRVALSISILSDSPICASFKSALRLIKCSDYSLKSCFVYGEVK